MSRIACILCLEAPLQALRRADPELAGAEVVVFEGRTVIAVSAEARARAQQQGSVVSSASQSRLSASAPGARRGSGLGAHDRAERGPEPRSAGADRALTIGMSLAEARAIAPEACFRARSVRLEEALDRALCDLAAGFSPRQEPGRGEVALDVADLGRLFESERHLAQAIAAQARRLGIEARIGVAGDKTTARVAALWSELEVVPEGREAAFLAPLPIELLGPSAAALVLLRRFGVHRIGELQNLPAGGVALRLGQEGARLARCANGRMDAPLVPRPEPLLFEESLELEWPVETLDPLLFLVRRMVDNLIERLRCRALAVSGLELSLQLATRVPDTRSIAVAAPTRDAATLLQLLRLAMERAPPAAAVEGLSLRAHPSSARPAQLAFFEPPGPSPDKLATTLAHLAALVGEDRVGAPAVPDRHRPDAFALMPFVGKARAIGSEETVLADPRPMTGCRPLALHAFRPARPAAVRFDAGRLRFVQAELLGGQVIVQAGPYRVREGWWEGTPIARDYYDVELSDGGVYRLYLDLEHGGFYVDGCYE